MTDLDKFMRPPDSIALSYDEAIAGPLWYGPKHDWKVLRFCSDSQASALAGVTERSLRYLQNSEIINATQAPLSGGGYRRVWHLPEVASAAMAEQFKLATNVNYSEADILFHASLVTKLMFAVQALLLNSPALRASFTPELIFADGRLFVLRAPAITQRVIEKLAPSFFYFDGEIAPIAASDKDGAWKAFPPDRRTAPQDRGIKVFQKSKFFVVLSLARIFLDLERKAKELRP